MACRGRTRRPTRLRPRERRPASSRPGRQSGARLQNQHSQASVAQALGRRQPGNSRSDDDDVVLWIGFRHIVRGQGLMLHQDYPFRNLDLQPNPNSDAKRASNPAETKLIGEHRLRRFTPLRIATTGPAWSERKLRIASVIRNPLRNTSRTKVTQVTERFRLRGRN